jgi:hypothetical protein
MSLTIYLAPQSDLESYAIGPAVSVGNNHRRPVGGLFAVSFGYKLLMISC